MFEKNKQKLTECTRCRTEYDARQQFCPQCNVEISAAGGRIRLPLIIYPILVMFGICLLYFAFR